MENKKVLLISLCLLILGAIVTVLIISQRDSKTYTEYIDAEPEYDVKNMETIFNDDLIPDVDRSIVETYLIANKSDLISKGVPEEFFDTIEITMHNDSIYTLVAGDKMISIGLDADGLVEYCNVY